MLGAPCIKALSISGSGAAVLERELRNFRDFRAESGCGPRKAPGRAHELLMIDRPVVCMLPARPMRSAAKTLKTAQFALMCLAFPRLLFGQASGTEVALAEALYQEARELFAAADYAAACPKFAESYRLDPATG